MGRTIAYTHKLSLSRHCTHIVSIVFRKRSSFWFVQRKHFAKTTHIHTLHITKTNIKCADSVVEWFFLSFDMCLVHIQIYTSPYTARRTCDLMAKNVNYAMLKRHINAKFNYMVFSVACYILFIILRFKCAHDEYLIR